MRRLPWVVSLMLLATPLIAAPASSPMPAVTLADIFAPAVPAPTASSGSGLPGPRLSANCTAHCQGGSTVNCSGTSCSAVDYSCSTGQRGSCTAGGTTTYCPAPVCPKTCTASCAGAGGGSVSCTSQAGNCFAINNCYANCDENYFLCPHPAGNCPF